MPTIKARNGKVEVALHGDERKAVAKTIDVLTALAPYESTAKTTHAALVDLLSKYPASKQAERAIAD